MINKKGFTLIELLAVIVILAIIMVIAVPRILDVIEKTEMESYRESVELMVRTAKIQYEASEIQGPAPTIPDEGIAYIYGFDELKNDTVQTNIDEVGLLNFKGDKPRSGSIILNKDKKVKVEKLVSKLKNGKYCAIKSYDGNVLVGKSTDSGFNCSSGGSTEVPEPVSFSTDSWETIATYNTSSKYKVGDTKEISLDINEDGILETYNLMIINMLQCGSTVNSQSGCGMVIQFKELLNITDAGDKKMNSSATNAGGWPASKMYTFLNTTIYGKLPSDLKNVIISTKTVSGHDNRITSNYVSNDDKLYLLSSQEVGFSVNNDSAPTESRTLDYFIGKGNSGRLKYVYGTTSTERWWLRTAASNRHDDFLFVYSDGASNGGYANSELGVCPAFRVGKQ